MKKVVSAHYSYQLRQKVILHRGVGFDRVLASLCTPVHGLRRWSDLKPAVDLDIDGDSSDDDEVLLSTSLIDMEDPGQIVDAVNFGDLNKSFKLKTINTVNCKTFKCPCFEYILNAENLTFKTFVFLNDC